MCERVASSAAFNKIRLESYEDRMHSWTNTTEYVARMNGPANAAATDACLRIVLVNGIP